MKKIIAVFALSAMVLMISCGCSKKENRNDEPDSGETVTDEEGDTADDSEPRDSEPGDTEPSNSEPDDPENPDTTPEPTPDDDGDSQSDDDADTAHEPTEAEKCGTAGGTWNAIEETCTKTTECTGKPENAEWNGASSYKQTYTDGAWSAEIPSEYDTEEGACHYKCVENSTNIESECLMECSPKTTFPCYDSESRLSWSKKSAAEMKLIDTDASGNEIFPAQAYCEDLNASNYGGFTDWRLPTISELRTLIQNCPTTQMPPVEGVDSCAVSSDESNLCLSSSSCDSSACACSYDEEGGYSKFGEPEWLWSSSLDSDSSHGAWFVGFDFGGVGANDILYDNYVRCVR